MSGASDTAVTVEDPRDAVAEWFEKMSLYCSSVDYDSARPLFDPDVAAFGTYADEITGLERLQREQWEQVWPRTSGFRVLMDSVRAAGDARFAWGLATWTSTGYTDDGRAFDRPGRVTVVLRRADGRWRAVHTHFSQYPTIAT